MWMVIVSPKAEVRDSCLLGCERTLARVAVVVKLMPTRNARPQRLVVVEVRAHRQQIDEEARALP
jgi:hypothetical protein